MKRGQMKQICINTSDNRRMEHETNVSKGGSQTRMQFVTSTIQYFPSRCSE